MPFAMLDGRKEITPVSKRAQDLSLDLRIWKWESRYPERLSLVNPMNRSSYPMKFSAAYKISAIQNVDSKFSPKISLTTDSKVSDAYYLKAFTVRTDEALLEGVKKATGSFRVDGETLVDHVCLMDLVKARETVFGQLKKGPCLFDAEEDGRWVGYMLPRASNISFELSDLPTEFDPFKIIVEFELASYST